MRDEELRRFGEGLHTKVIFFSSLRTLEKGLYLNGEVIEYNDGENITQICDVKELNLLGRHNYEKCHDSRGNDTGLRRALRKRSAMYCSASRL